ncbi:MAG TPA: FHA domain-containing protein [Ktedonobacterales bacterium]|nr:FHA domain-containing protein [Ktedonobacterales bacterium]
MASVEIQTPDGVVQAPLDRDHLTIGRLASNTIALPYPHISRQHAELRLMGQTWWIVDLRSTNGLHVGGQRVGECRLTPDTYVMLSPLVTLRLLEDRPAAFAPPVAPAAQYPSGYRLPLQAPVPPAPPPSPPSHAGPISLAEPITPLSALGPRSVYSDDEAPFYPQMRQPSGPSHPPHPPYQRGPASPSLPGAPGGWPASPAPASPAPTSMPDAAQRHTAYAAPSSLLHVCQTCGQRTMPDAVYCQNCHHSIASECVRCRLSLLPIQDLCPRCQTPNPASVRRPRPAGAW